jgi:hypothetical protein
VLHWDKLAPFPLTATSSKLACMWIGRMNKWASCTTCVSPTHSQEHNPVQSLGRLTPPPLPPNKTEKHKQQTVI